MSACGKCGLPVDQSETGLRYFGTYTAHSEERCIWLLKDLAEKAEAECERLRERLEITHATDGNGNRIPFPAGAPDGIACRDETIRLLEAKCERLREELRLIAQAKPDEWEPDMRDQFREWAQSRARAAIDAARGEDK